MRALDRDVLELDVSATGPDDRNHVPAARFSLRALVDGLVADRYSDSFVSPVDVQRTDGLGTSGPVFVTIKHFSEEQ